MQNYKDADGKVYALDSSEDEHLLPMGCVPITQAEVNALRTPSLADLKAAKLVNVNRNFQAMADYLTAGYPPAEKETWSDQKIEAMAWDANNAIATPYIDALAAYRGIDRDIYLAKTRDKVVAYSGAAQRLVGTRQKYADQVTAASNAAQVAAIDPVFTLS